MIVERPRRGVVAWIQRRCSVLADPAPVERIETRSVDGMALRDMELLATYALTHRGVL